MLAAKDTVHKLIPQGPPMIMVDELLEHDDHRSLTGFSIEEDNIFAEAGNFSQAGLIENMAQSAALHTGWMGLQKQVRNEQFRPSIGMIGGIKNFKLYRLPQINTTIQTEIIIQAEVMNALMITGRVLQDKEELASCELKIFIQEQGGN